MPLEADVILIPPSEHLVRMRQINSAMLLGVLMVAGSAIAAEPAKAPPNDLTLLLAADLTTVPDGKLHADEITNLKIAGLAPGEAVTVSLVGDASAPLSSVAGPDGVAALSGVTFADAGALNILTGTGKMYAATVLPLHTEDDFAPKPSGPTALPPSQPTPVGAEASRSHIWSEEVRYGHWKAVYQWYRIDNDNDASNRYFTTVSKWLGVGDTNSNPWHRYTTVWHSYIGWRADGNTFVSDFDPSDVSPTTTTRGFSVGPGGLGVDYSWSQTAPAKFTPSPYQGSDPSWDEDVYREYADFTAMYTQPGYTGWLEYAASGVAPTGNTAYMYMREKHESRSCSLCATIYTDDTGWKLQSVTWS